jgi:hypothetical protein
LRGLRTPGPTRKSVVLRWSLVQSAEAGLARKIETDANTLHEIRNNNNQNIPVVRPEVW